METTIVSSDAKNIKWRQFVISVNKKKVLCEDDENILIYSESPPSPRIT